MSSQQILSDECAKYLSQLNACVREPDVERYIAFIITDAICRTRNAPALFRDLMEYSDQNGIDPPFEDLQWTCEELIMSGVNAENANSWSLLVQFYRKVSYFQICNLLFVGKIVIDHLNFIGHPRLQGLYQRFKYPGSEEKIALGNLLVPSSYETFPGDEGGITSDDIDMFNREFAPVLFWPDEVMNAFFFDENDEVIFENSEDLIS